MMTSLRVTMALLLLAPFAVDSQPAGRIVIPVRYGYFPEARPNHAGCARGWFDLDVPSTNRYYRVTCYPQTSGNYAAQRLDNLQLDIANLGSTPWAQAAARGVDATVVYISHYMGESQGLYVRPNEPEQNYTRIVTPYDLEGRNVAVPFGSTMHYQILFLIDMLDLTGRVNLVNLPPSEIIKAWDAGSIDAAGCWGMARDHLLGGNDEKRAITLATAGLLANWGRPTFVVTAATRTFASSHPQFMTHFVGVLSRINDSFLDRFGQDDPLNSKRWLAEGPVSSSYVPSLVDALMLPDEAPSDPSPDSIYRARRTLDTFLQQNAAEQISCQYLGPGPGQCDRSTKQHLATIQTAEFLLDQKILARLGPLEDPEKDYRFGSEHVESCSDASTFCGGDMLNGQYLAEARRACTKCLPVGPYAADTEPVSSEPEGGADLLLAALERQDSFNNHTGYASTEVGRAGGDSRCGRQRLIGNGSPVVGAFGDGANTKQGKSYSEDMDCKWEIRSVDCDTAASPCQDVVEINFEHLRLWSADFVRVYADPKMKCNLDSATKVLVGQFTGFHDERNPPPPIRSMGCLLIVFSTDSNQERTYGGDSGDGLVVQYNRKASGCISNSDCGRGRCMGNGLCECDGQSWGADCSETHCLGRSRVLLEGNLPRVLKSSSNLEPRLLRGDSVYNTFALNPYEAYPNDLDCTFELVVPDGYSFVRVEIFFDLEPTYDLLWLEQGAGSESETYAVLTGVHRQTGGPEEYFLPTRNGLATLHLTTDSIGRRRGFYATIHAVRDDDQGFIRREGCQFPGQSGYGCEFEHCIAQNELARPEQGQTPSPYALGSVVSQNPDWPTRGHGSVPALPWAPEGGCIWPLLPNGLPQGTDDIVALRLAFNFPFDLEPHPVSSVGDKLVIRQLNPATGANVSKFWDTELFVEQCDSDEVCSFPWQTGVCSENGGCIIENTVEIALNPVEDMTGDTPSAILITDRNDGGLRYSGLNFDVLLVEACPIEEDSHCENAPGGKCVDGFCFCGDVPCACPCDGGASISTGVKIAVVIVIVVPIFCVLFAFFLLYRRRKIRKSRLQKSIIKEKEAELEAFRDSVVGMRTAIKTYVPTASTRERPSEQPKDQKLTPQPASQSIWCWKETEGFMSNHDPSTIYGDPSLCWVQYNEEATSKLEAAFVEQGGAGQCSPLKGYVVSFDTMLQTKKKTGFQRNVQRVVKTAAAPPEVDLSDIEFAEELPQDLVNEPQMVLVEGDVIQISKQRPDGWAFGTKLQHADEALARQLLLVAISDASADDSSILTDTGWFKLDATRVPTGEDLAALHTRVGHSGALDPPEYWDPVVDPTVVQHHVLPEGDEERKSVEEAFLSTLPPTRKTRVLRVERIQNLAMWQSYVVKRQTICYRESEGKNDDEATAGADVVTQKALDRFERRWLWHGSNVEVLDKIIQQGFNRSFCGRNAVVYGRGVYFARDASYSANRTYSIPDKDGTQYMMACRVVVGEYCPGTYDALTPDLRDAEKNILYDSTVGLLQNDSMNSPSIYVTYHDAQAYPEYLIAFKSSR